MKELEKVKNISIASVVFILAVIIGLLMYERPQNIFELNTKATLENLTDNNFFVDLNDINNANYAIIDVRSEYEYDKGHLKNAKNIYTPEILKESNLDYFKNLKEAGKTAVLYGSNPEEVNTPLLILYQLGYNNIKLLKAKNTYLQNKLITTPIEVEKSEADIASFIKESAKNKDVAVPVKVVAPVKKVITVQKQKKMPVEGGC